MIDFVAAEKFYKKAEMLGITCELYEVNGKKIRGHREKYEFI